MVKNSTANAGDIRDVGLILGWEDSLEEGMATRFSNLAGESHGQRNLVGYSPKGDRVSHNQTDLPCTHTRKNN